MTLQLLRKARDKLTEIKLPADTKRAVWAAMTFLFLGSLRGSEILSTDSKKFDLQKTLLGADLKMVTVQAQGEKVETLRIKLKQPKTSRSQPTQIVELQTTGGWLCPVSAYKNWQKVLEGGCPGGVTSLHMERGESDNLG